MSYDSKILVIDSRAAHHYVKQGPFTLPRFVPLVEGTVCCYRAVTEPYIPERCPRMKICFHSLPICSVCSSGIGENALHSIQCLKNGPVFLFVEGFLVNKDFLMPFIVKIDKIRNFSALKVMEEITSSSLSFSY